MTTTRQPVSHIEWVDPNTLHANDYNPNRVFRPEMRLLKLSILEDGWTQPIVARPDGEIVDGYHRWTLAREDADIQNLTGGLCPVTRLTPAEDPLHQRMSTIRHNRARGQHHVIKMADIVHDLHHGGIPTNEISRRLGMDDEEVTRLLDRGQMTTRHGTSPLHNGWAPTDHE
jgi:hypothetical protein